MSDLISRNALIRRFAYYHAHSYGKAEYAYGVAVEEALKAPTIDAVPVVRCRECKESEPLSVLDTDCLYCGVWDTAVHFNGYCYHGARMDGGAEG